MAKIIYKKGLEGQNEIESIEGIEIDLMNGQKALIFPRYGERRVSAMRYDVEESGNAGEEFFTALKKTDAREATEALAREGSPAAKFVLGFGNFYLPTLMAALEIADQAKEIDALAETIYGVDWLADHYEDIASCTRSRRINRVWAAEYLGGAEEVEAHLKFLCVPTRIYSA